MSVRRTFARCASPSTLGPRLARAFSSRPPRARGTPGPPHRVASNTLRWIVPVSLLALISGCARGGSQSSPRATLTSFHRAVERNDVAALYQLLPAQARREESFERFRARMQSESAELRTVSNEVRNALDARRDPWIAMSSRAGGAVTVVDTAEGWRLGRSLVGPGPAPTAQDAARALHAAIARRSLSAILAALSSRARGAVQSELAMLLDALADPAALEARPASAGSGASEAVALRLPDGRSLILVREGREWRVDDIQ